MTREQLQKVLSYDRETGVFQWLDPKRACRGGVIAGTIDHHGYRMIAIDGKKFKASRLAWLYVTGTFPPDLIDHKNRDKADDRFSNLREATYPQNGWNADQRATNTSGFKGVAWDKNRHRWIAFIRVGEGQRISLGRYDTAEEAGAVYREAAMQHHGRFVPEAD